MASTSRPPAEAAGPFIRFEVRDGIRRVSCAVSHDALEAASGVAGPMTETMRRRCFDRFRVIIDSAATLKLRALPAGPPAFFVLTRDDLRRVPPRTGDPVFGLATR